MEKIMVNGTLKDKTTTNIPQGSGLVYEVIRVIGGAPLFFEEHWVRFVNSIRSKSSAAPPDPEEFRTMTDNFIQSVPKADFNYKVLFDSVSRDLYFLENPTSYPDPSLYARGIDTEILTYRREDPHAKITNAELTALAAQKRQETGAYELLLTDPDGSITEGSRSNVFFVTKGQLVTPPLESVLPGVTRQKIIETAADLKIIVNERDIKSVDLHIYEGAFITGTSPKILPIRRIGGTFYSSAGLALIKDLMEKFDQVIEEDLKKYRTHSPR